jgi:LPS sulfotransferase NodH
MQHLRFETLTKDLIVDDEARIAECEKLVPAHRQYVIFFTARSGSTWLTSALSATKQLGVPEEYINPDFIPDICRAVRARTQQDMFQVLFRRRKSPNGVFGIEVRHIDVELFGIEQFFDIFGPETVFFNLWRDNMVSQAVSLYRAVNTGRFHSTDTALASTPTYDAAGIKRWMTHLLNTENKNLRLLASEGRPARFLRYEDILRHEATTVGMIADALRVDLAPNQAPEDAPPKQEKLGDTWNREAEATFRSQEPQFVAETEAARLIRRQPGDEGWLNFPAVTVPA